MPCIHVLSFSRKVLFTKDSISSSIDDAHSWYSHILSTIKDKSYIKLRNTMDLNKGLLGSGIYLLRYLHSAIACMVWLAVEFTCTRCANTLYKLRKGKQKRITDFAWRVFMYILWKDSVLRGSPVWKMKFRVICFVFLMSTVTTNLVGDYLLYTKIQA